MSMYGKKPLQYCKVISLQWIKINGKKIKTNKVGSTFKKSFQTKGMMTCQYILRKYVNPHYFSRKTHLIITEKYLLHPLEYQKLKSWITPRLGEIWKIRTHYPSVLAPFGKHFDIIYLIWFCICLGKQQLHILEKHWMTIYSEVF